MLSAIYRRLHPTLHSFPTRRSSDLPTGLRLSPVSTFRRAPSPRLQETEERQSCPIAISSLPWAFSQARPAAMSRSEEHTSELQSPVHLVCRLLLEYNTN